MPFEVHQEKEYLQVPSIVFDAGLKSIKKLDGKIIANKTEELTVEVKFDKTLLGKVLGDRTQMTVAVQPNGDGSKIIVDIYPLDAVGRKLMFGARKGVPQEVLRLFTENLEANLI